MACSRCGGLMVSVLLEDRESTYCQCPGLRCVSCGEIFDELIAQHRAASVRTHVQEEEPLPSDYRFEYWSDGI